MICDIFLFHSELDLLDIRLNILGDHVDKFFIFECDEDFSGKPRELFFPKNKDRYKKWEDKIVYNVIKDIFSDHELVALARSSPNTGQGETQWIREFYMKESMKKFLHELNDDDTCFVSDLDEIWNPDMTIPRGDEVFKLKQFVYVYYLNNRSTEDWSGTLMTSYKTIKEGVLNHLKAPTIYNKTIYTVLPNNGWHFTSQGGYEQVYKKITSSDTSVVYYGLTVEQVMHNVINNRDYLGRNFTFFVDETDWPQYLKDNKDKYKHLCK